jgi:crotonobetainyl-CoA:carnitine CoA-transferase CaiB-like acyl-CoA transferase
MARIVELTDLAGAYASRLFAEQGHEVIRVEGADGNLLRSLPPFLPGAPDGESSAYHQFLNAGKRSLAVDLDSATGQEILSRLIAAADVLIADRVLPLDEARLIEANPKLVVTKIADCDPDICAMARSGLMSLTGQPDQSPMILGGDLAVLATGIYVAVATAAAMLSAERNGKGSIVTVSLREALESFVEQAMVEFTFSGIVTERRGSKGAITAISGALPCKDGHWVISQIHRPGRWSKFVEWIADPQLAADPSLAEEENQIKRRDFILDRVLSWASQHGKNDLVEEAQARHFPASPVSTTLDLIDDPQLIARGFLTETLHREFGRIMYPQGPLASMRKLKLAPAPRLGEHNRAILAALGCPFDDPKSPPAAGALQE